MTRESIEHPLIPADRVNGTEVMNQDGDVIGKIEDIAIDKLSGKVAYAIVSFGGFLGIGERYHPVPWSVLRYDTDLKGYVAPLTKEQLNEAPTFDRSELSGWDDSAYREGVYGYYGPYGAAPYWGPMAW
jgi:sporulation protein YlmC with PRC-barrel domain